MDLVIAGTREDGSSVCLVSDSLFSMASPQSCGTDLDLSKLSRENENRTAKKTRTSLSPSPKSQVLSPFAPDRFCENKMHEGAQRKHTNYS